MKPIFPIALLLCFVLSAGCGEAKKDDKKGADAGTTNVSTDVKTCDKCEGECTCAKTCDKCEGECTCATTSAKCEKCGEGECQCEKEAHDEKGHDHDGDKHDHDGDDHDHDGDEHKGHDHDKDGS